MTLSCLRSWCLDDDDRREADISPVNIIQTSKTLPTEILLHICSSLDLLSQACLALTSRSHYQSIGFVLKDKKLQFPVILYDENGNRYFDTQKPAMRTDLVLRLENERWAYCGACLKLHPRDEFYTIYPEQPPQERSCRYPGIVVKHHSARKGTTPREVSRHAR